MFETLVFFEVSGITGWVGLGSSFPEPFKDVLSLIEIVSR